MKILKMRKTKKELNLQHRGKIAKLRWLPRKFQTKKNIEQKNSFSLLLTLYKWEIKTLVTQLIFIDDVVFEWRPDFFFKKLCMKMFRFHISMTSNGINYLNGTESYELRSFVIKAQLSTFSLKYFWPADFLL